MAHSFITAFAGELDAFRAYVGTFPKNAILLIDTYDTLRGARHAVEIARELAARGENLLGVRLDSGNIGELAPLVRRIFDEAGFMSAKIIASGGLDEHDLERFSAQQTPIDSYGIGTKLGVSADAPWTDAVYKLVEYEGRPVLKLSAGKKTWPGKKQVFRFANRDGEFSHDVIGGRDERNLGAEPLLERVIQAGEIAGALPALNDSRSLCREELARLPQSYKRLIAPEAYPVKFSRALQNMRASAEKRLTN
jgi:nicotinate phosphoribosyltransferase